MKYKQLNSMQRYTIKCLHQQGMTQKIISESIGVSQSTISRELDRNKTSRGKYDDIKAEENARFRKELTHRKCVFTNSMKRIFTEKLRLRWSCEQIVGYCRLKGISMVSKETLYKYIYSPEGCQQELHKYLRTGRKRRFRRVTRKTGRGICIKDRISIDSRPAIINEPETGR